MNFKRNKILIREDERSRKSEIEVSEDEPIRRTKIKSMKKKAANASSKLAHGLKKRGFTIIFRSDHSTNSPMSTASFGYYRINSEMSTFSEPADSFSKGMSPVKWAPPKVGTPPPALSSRLGLRKYVYNIDSEHDDLEAMYIGILFIRARAYEREIFKASAG